VLVAADRHHVGPVGRRHDDSGDLGAGDVEGGGTVLVGALDAGAAVTVGRLSVAEDALLREDREQTPVVQGEPDLSLQPTRKETSTEPPYQESPWQQRAPPL